MARLRTRPAFTLVELLVVIAIIGILVGLLLPAVQSAREAARRISCTNNLERLGLALHNYHDSFRTFPPGGITEGRCCGTKSLTTWAVAILPFMEQTALFERYDQNAYNEDPENAFVREQFVGAYICPSDVETDRLERPSSGPGRRLYYAPGSYRAVSGLTNGRCWADNEQIWRSNSFCFRNRGVLHHVGTRTARTERFADIVDGTSSTLVIGEMHTLTQNRRRTFWAYTYTSYNQSGICPLCGPRTLLGDYRRCVRLRSGWAGGSNACKRGWGSNHLGVLQFLLADGSVRGFSKNTNMELLGALSTIKGRELVQLDE